MTNRLHLDFGLTTTTERQNFITQYLQSNMFQLNPPTDEELELMANYLLWGKDPITGLNAKQQLGIDIETKHGTWDRSQRIESLEALTENPLFSEASISELATPALKPKPKREVFSRTEALSKCAPALKDKFLSLFREIDTIELGLNFYELAHNKRKNQPRDLLVKRFSEEEVAAIKDKALRWNQPKYLKLKHELVELRREQYSLRDSYAGQSSASSDELAPSDLASNLEFEGDVQVLPLGIRLEGNQIAGLLFRENGTLCPKVFNEEELRIISDFVWEKKKFKPSGTLKWFDFRNVDHVYQLINMLDSLREKVEYDEASDRIDKESTLRDLLRTLDYYIAEADLKDIQRDILDLKIKKVKNSDIAWKINHDYGKSYTTNYISTIFRQRILPKIGEAAARHLEIVENLFFAEEFKECSVCGKVLLKNTDNFMKKSRSVDGLAPRCKRCEKKLRIK